jgi:membrane protein
MDMKARLERLDQAQQHRPALAIPLATVKKFGEDKSSGLASMMAFWAFFSIFPLLMAAITVLSWVVPEPDRARVLKQVGDYFPLLDISTIAGLQGSLLALLIGLGAALWSGSAVVRVTQEAFNAVWEVPKVERPKLLEQIKRSLLAMATIGLGLLASVFTIGFVSGDNPAVDLGPLSMVLGFALAIALDIGLFIVAFRMLTDRQISTRDVLPGAVFSGVAFWILQTISSIIITRHLSSAQATYGTFATVITILWWFYLQSQLTLLGAQVNVVLKRHYWPRGLVNPPDTEADHRLLADYAKEQTLIAGEHVAVHVPGGGHAEPTGADQGETPDQGGAGSSAGNRTRAIPAQSGRASTPGRGLLDHLNPAPTQGQARDQAPRDQASRDEVLREASGEDMPPGEQTIAQLLHSAAEQTKRLVRDEVALAGAELKAKGRRAGKGVGLLGAAGIVAGYGAGALLAAVIMLIGMAIGAWAAALITVAGLAGAGAALALVGKKQLGRAGPLRPEHAAAEFAADISVVKERIHR